MVGRNLNKKKKNYVLRFFFTLSIILGLFLGNPAVSKAEGNEIGTKQSDIKTSEKDTSNDVGFSIEPVLPSNQVDQSKGFYYLKVKPGDEQEVILNVKSTKKEAAKLKIYIKDAYTNPNGFIDYDGKNYHRDKTLKQSVEDITSLSHKKITVKNFESKEVKIKIKVPGKEFDGIKAAAVCVMSDNNIKESKKQGLSSSYGYRLGLIVTEEDEEYEKGKSLKLLRVKPTIHSGKRVIQARFQNPEPQILGDLTVKTKLRKKGNSEVLRSRTTNNMRMAPNSQFDFATNWGLDPLRPGTYVLSIRANSNGKSWKWEKEFTIGNKEAKKINEEASYTLTYPNWTPIVVVLLGIITLVLFGLLYMRRKKWNAQ